ncbi:MAG: hypothetical protein MUO33_09835, partial [Sedimentisphaerales bacterium]|nr:hypothetical protein [Sedimentisphaerales bacterium]
MRNRILVIVIAFIFFPGVAACSGAQERIQLTALSSMERIGQEQKPYGPRPAPAKAGVEIKAAKNEVESFQVIVTA